MTHKGFVMDKEKNLRILKGPLRLKNQTCDETSDVQLRGVLSYTVGRHNVGL